MPSSKCYRRRHIASPRDTFFVYVLTYFLTYANSGVGGYVHEHGDRYAPNVTSFDIFDDVTRTSDVSRCDVADEKVVAAQYSGSPATRQV